MAYSKVEVWNLAVSAIGGRALISSETETGREADLCRLWYPLVRDVVLKAAPWPSASTRTRLALLATRDADEDWTTSDPAPGWVYAYSAPSDMLSPQHLTTYARFNLETYGSQKAIVTNTSEAILRYTKSTDNPNDWDTGLVKAISYALGAALALPLTGKRTLFADLKQVSEEAIMLARTDIANERDNHHEMLPSWVATRGYEDLPYETRFVWPYEDLSGVLS
jgi:hypothetical protein